ncbi:tRNA lysidine(34) synthetase TilS [Thalassotalea sp. 1_MG-2023]|uniref:tRNA lysidine(34) synthetase TilS n=1 Tax=Thalassotalea sp. 1_MG-2023 TaxID=3062680 RepID=UPI0026E43794|nr:tRNA lysidine(34) synthetase TilS [Thalassotalea sp. 1_MG-2023]MDO6426746.1 tRNA lysidine(34) synthetase TilS [Thalassotalea sp. 1_MG-2023]
MNSIYAQFQQQLLPFIECPICIAYSGGIDSQVLLHLFARLKKTTPLLSITACHVNHGLSKDAGKWQNFAAKQCALHGISLNTETVHLVKESRQSLEAIAREARYKVFDQVTPSNALIVTGHHLNDQMESFILALKRGSGVQGLAAIKPVSQFRSTSKTLLRPLLSISRQEIEAYANENKLLWVEDESNNDPIFDRNFIRHQITPILESRWPSIAYSIARTVSHCQETQTLIDEIAAQDLAKCCPEQAKGLCIDALLDLSTIRRKHVIRFFLASHNITMPSEQQLQQLFAGLSVGSESKRQVKVGDGWLRQYQGKLYLTQSYTDVQKWQQVIDVQELVDSPIHITLPDNMGTLTLSHCTKECTQAQVFSVDNTTKELTVSFTQPQDKVLPDYRQHRREMKKVWQELNVAPWLRKRTPMIYLDKQLVAVATYFVCQPYVKDKHQLNIKVDWLE